MCELHDGYNNIFSGITASGCLYVVYLYIFWLFQLFVWANLIMKLSVSMKIERNPFLWALTPGKFFSSGWIDGDFQNFIYNDVLKNPTNFQLAMNNCNLTPNFWSILKGVETELVTYTHTLEMFEGFIFQILPRKRAVDFLE